MAAEIDALQLGYKIGFINDSQVWLLMLKKYNTSVYSYNEDEVDETIVLIHDSFIPSSDEKCSTANIQISKIYC